MEQIEKEYEIYEDSVALCLIDTRDNYVDKNSLGEIGTIYISPFGVLIYETPSIEETLERKREKKLQEEFKLIFKEECNPISEKYYKKILSMIESGVLGYTVRNVPNKHEENDTLSSSPKRRRK